MTYKLTGKIIGLKGKCPAGHVAGEEIDLTIEGKKGVAKYIKLCPYFLNKAFPYLCTMQFGGQLPDEKDPNSVLFDCLSSEHDVKMRVQRTPVKEKK